MNPINLSYDDYQTIRTDERWMELKRTTNLFFDRASNSWSVSSKYHKRVQSTVNRILGMSKDEATQTTPCHVNCTCLGEGSSNCTVCGLQYSISFIKRPKNKLPLRQGVTPVVRELKKKDDNAKEIELEGCNQCAGEKLRLKCLYCGMEVEINNVKFPSTKLNSFSGRYH